MKEDGHAEVNRPPKWAIVFLRWFCPPELYETIEGDLIEQFEIDKTREGERKAQFRFVWNVIKFVRPGIIARNTLSIHVNPFDMLSNHLKFALRIFLKDKFFSTLNILGLALGISVSMILLLILQNDLTYDQYHVNHKNIYRLGCHIEGGNEFRSALSPRELGDILKEEFPEVQAVARAFKWERSLVKYEINGTEKNFYEEGLVRTEPAFFRIFTYEFVAGQPETSLSDPYTLVVTESIAKKYFGSTDALSKVLFINDRPWKVTGVIKDIPANTHLRFDVLLSGMDAPRDWAINKGHIVSEALWNPDVFVYLLMPEHYNTHDFQAKFPLLYDKYFKSFGDRVGGKYTPILEPLTDIHFNSDLIDDEPRGKIGYVYAFTGVGLFIILLACINYMNLSTAKSMNRATEIAIKKIVGSGKRSLVLSLLGESVFLSCISLALAIALVFLVLNETSFCQIIGKDLTADFLHNRILLFGSPAIAIGIGIISGLYPAFYMPTIPTISTLKGAFRSGKSSHMFRNVLITLQFAISLFVVACTLSMGDQIDYVRNKELGFDKDNVLVLPIQDDAIRTHISAITNELLTNPQIKFAATSSPWSMIGQNVGGTFEMWAEGPSGMKLQGFAVMFVGEDYLRTLGMKLVKGRDFHPGHTVDIDHLFIANEAAARAMNWGNEPLGKKVRFFHDDKDGQVIGIVKDFNFNSLHNPVKPLLIVKMDQEKEAAFLHLKIKGGSDISKTIQSVKDTWKRFDPSHPFECSFLDQRFYQQYKEDEIQKTLLSWLSYLCIFISLLGLVGLCTFTATQRTKEIGVRKVLGASVADIIILLSRNVLFLVILAAILVIPASYWVMTRWMENFAYRMELNYFLFFVITVAALCFVFLTVVVQSLKTARSNPVDSLKYE